MRLPGLISQSSVPRLVRICVMLGREAAVLRRERIREHFDRLDALAREIEIEIAGGRIDQAGTADLQRALRRLAALDAQAAVGGTHDAGQDQPAGCESHRPGAAQPRTTNPSMSLIDTDRMLLVGDGVEAQTLTGSITNVS